MKTQRIALLFCVTILMVSAGAGSARGQAPDRAELERVIAAAARCESGQSSEPFRQLEAWVRLAVAQPAGRPELEAGLLKLLGPEATVEARGFACKQLGVLGSASALPALAELLPNPETGGFACLALTTYPRGKADEVLRGALVAAQGRARVQILNTLGDRRDELAVPALVAAAWGTDRPVAEAAIASLGKVGNPEARTALAALRERGARPLQAVVLDALLRCAGQLAARGEKVPAMALYEQLVSAAQPVDVRRSAFAALLRLEPARAEQRILQVLRHAEAALIPTAIAAIAWVPSPEGSQAFVRELPGLEPEEQVLLLNSLVRRGDHAAVAAISQQVDSPEPLVRRTALNCLGRAGDIEVVPVLVRALVELRNPEELRTAELALAELGGGSATDAALLEALHRSAGPLRVRLVRAVARREGERANPLLLEEASNENPAVAVAALRALGQSARPGDVPVLLAKLVETHHPDVSAEAESAALQATGRIEDPAQRSALVRGALDRAQTVSGHSALLALLPSCGDAPALEAVRVAAASAEPPIHEAAMRALADWPDASAWDPLARVYREAKAEQDRGLALHGLVRLAGEANAHPDAVLVGRYRKLLEAAKSDGEVKMLLGALGGVAHPEALDLAQTFVDRPGVKAEAEVAVKKISEALKDKKPQVEAEAPKK